MHDFKAEMTDRTRNFALPVFRLCKSLHGCYEMEHVGRQLLRSATSIVVQYRAAQHAFTSENFLYKMKVCEEAADETAFWLDMLMESNMVKHSLLAALLHEAHRIAAIIAASCITLSKRKSQITRPS